MELQNLVEFSITRSNEPFITCSSESLFLDEPVFDLFLSCFEKSNKLFDYNEPTKYNTRKIFPLLNELKSFEKEIESLKSQDSFTDFLKKKSMGLQFLEHVEKDDPNWKVNWKKYRQEITDVCQKFISLVNRCCTEDKVLWVKGY
ncbi:MAG: hypothetical protein JSV24_11085 [Bacteroidales bacterium]|nr:MAG: hypothetical protein JSV24_11085 [Bacteroidales bacterium]